MLKSSVSEHEIYHGFLTVYPCHGHFWQRGNDGKPVDAGTYSILRAESFCGWLSGIWRVKFHQHLVGTRASTFLSCHLSSSWASLFSFGSCFLPTTMLAAFSDPAVCIFLENRRDMHRRVCQIESQGELYLLLWKYTRCQLHRWPSVQSNWRLPD